jgi:hypothetical protein
MGAEEERETIEPGDDDPPDSSLGRPRCPRCGGLGAPPRYRPRANPFLFKPAPGHLVCEDCGLDYWDETHGPPPSSKSPW